MESQKPIDKVSSVIAPVVSKFPLGAKNQKAMIIGVSLAVVLLGLGSGYMLSGKRIGVAPTGPAIEGASVTSKEAGISDDKAFPDTAEGILKEGGIEGDGTHHLDRGMGPQKDVYVSSTVIDMGSFVGKKVQVWGQTITGRKAGWLMDVGKVKVIE